MPYALRAYIVAGSFKTSNKIPAPSTHPTVTQFSSYCPILALLFPPNSNPISLHFLRVSKWKLSGRSASRVTHSQAWPGFENLPKIKRGGCLKFKKRLFAYQIHERNKALRSVTDEDNENSNLDCFFLIDAKSTDSMCRSSQKRGKIQYHVALLALRLNTTRLGNGN